PNAGRRRDDQHDTKAEAVVAGGGNNVVVAECRAAAHGSVPPRTATDHTLPANTWAGRGFRRAGLVVIRIVKVFTPLPDITVHVVKTPGIRLQSSHRPCMALRVPVDPCVIH